MGLLSGAVYVTYLTIDINILQGKIKIDTIAAHSEFYVPCIFIDGIYHPLYNYRRA